eukprot:m.53943 g.53943  ORF g.53943 m.53943 type:complete len:358 (+) comp11378_c1_seq2:272-1345(+)
MSAPRSHLQDQCDELDQLFAAVLPLVKQYQLENGQVDETKVVDFATPSELAEVMDFTPPEQGKEMAELVECIKTTMKYSVRTGHPRFFDKLYAGSDSIGQLGEFLTAVFNTNVHTYAVSPVFAVMETAVIKRVAALLGFNPDTAEGSLVPGGTYANLTGMIIARHKYFPHVRMEGFRAEDKPIALCSAQAHYSVRRATMMLGFGMNGTVSVPAARNGCMDTIALEDTIKSLIAEGKKPFFVNATAGTTVMGGFDNLVEISRICKQYDLWLHVDGAWGGTGKWKRLVIAIAIVIVIVIPFYLPLNGDFWCNFLFLFLLLLLFCIGWEGSLQKINVLPYFAVSVIIMTQPTPHISPKIK